MNNVARHVTIRRTESRGVRHFAGFAIYTTYYYCYYYYYYYLDACLVQSLHKIYIYIPRISFL